MVVYGATGVLPFLANRLLNLANRSEGVGMTSAGAGQALPTATGFAVKQAIAALRKRNIATAPLLHRGWAA